ncbi:MAG: 4Fe-4S dicluster domain-containing protein [Flavobacteriales bacterium]|nr:4Fe-4S dicluster domain-containing protein [Flavobacteriales bacterium]MCB9448867.1 4Fe-4S dicluster domain-containing protein [Flavobacteriales bacterium]
MSKQIAFTIFFLAAIGVFGYTISRLRRFFKLTKKDFPLDNIPERIRQTLLVAFGQTKILRRPMIGLMHAFVWWGFLVITIGTAEMMVDGLVGTERFLGKILGPVYTAIMASGDVLAAFIVFACISFLARRYVIKVKRFSGVEMTPTANLDATVALLMILFLMVSLLGMNIAYVKLAGAEKVGVYPVSESLQGLVANIGGSTVAKLHELSWWTHIVLVLVFMNILPYSKHFHVFMSVPNVFFTRLGPYTKLRNMESVTKEVKAMLDPSATIEPQAADAPIPRFGVKDVEDVNWKNYADSLTCTQCGRCTSVCPANTTGKLLSPRKILVDLRHRMNDKGPGLSRDPQYTDGKALVGDYITQEELWACTTCNACVQECPVNIDHVSLIVDMRRSLVMEDSSAPESLVAMFTNIENNGAPWQFSPSDRMRWADDLFSNKAS